MGIFDRAKEPTARRTDDGDDRERERGGQGDVGRDRRVSGDADQPGPASGGEDRASASDTEQGRP